MKSLAIIWTAAVVTGLVAFTLGNHLVDAAIQEQQFDGYNSTTDYLQTAAGVNVYQNPTRNSLQGSNYAVQGSAVDLNGTCRWVAPLRADAVLCDSGNITVQ